LLVTQLENAHPVDIVAHWRRRMGGLHRGFCCEIAAAMMEVL
jgi:hypothetical protein